MGKNTERAILAGGCFWIMQQLLRHRDGVIATRVGWIGGKNESPTGEQRRPCRGRRGHLRSGPPSYRELLEYFFMVHRADLSEDIVGTCYRSEIFHMSEEQRVIAEETIQRCRRVRALARQGADPRKQGQPLPGGRSRATGLPSALSGRLSGALPAAAQSGWVILSRGRSSSGRYVRAA